MSKCQDDSCELTRCGKCGCHTVGNTLIAGLCQECFALEEDEENKAQEQYFLEQQRRLS